MRLRIVFPLLRSRREKTDFRGQRQGSQKGETHDITGRAHPFRKGAIH